MGIVFRQSIKTTLVTLTGALLGGLITFAYSFSLSKAELGLTNSIIYVAAIGQIFVMMGTGSLIAVFTQRYKYEDERRKALFTFGLLTTLATTVVLSTIFFLLKDVVVNLYNEQDQLLINQYYYLVPLLVAIWGIMTIFDCFLIAHVKIAISAFAREIVLRICNLSLLGLLFFQIISFHQYIIAAVLIYLIPLSILFFVSRKSQGFGISFNFRLFSKKQYFEMIHFSWYHLLIIASVNILGYLDTLMLAPLDTNGLKSAALYSIAAFITSIIYMPYRAMSTSSLPILNQAYIDKDDEKIKDLFTRAGINILIAAVGMFVLIAFNLDNAVRLLPEGYEAIKPVVLILLIGKLVDMATGLNNEVISISKHYKFNFRTTSLLIICIFILYTVYIPQYGIYGAAWVTTGALILFNAVKMIFLYVKMRLHPFTGKTWLILVAGLLAAGVGYIIPYILNPFVDAIIRSCVIMLVYVLSLIWFKPSDDLIAFLDNIKSNKRLF